MMLCSIGSLRPVKWQAPNRVCLSAAVGNRPALHSTTPCAHTAARTRQHEYSGSRSLRSLTSDRAAYVVTQAVPPTKIGRALPYNQPGTSAAATAELSLLDIAHRLNNSAPTRGPPPPADFSSLLLWLDDRIYLQLQDVVTTTMAAAGFTELEAGPLSESQPTARTVLGYICACTLGKGSVHVSSLQQYLQLLGSPLTGQACMQYRYRSERPAHEVCIFEEPKRGTLQISPRVQGAHGSVLELVGLAIRARALVLRYTLCHLHASPGVVYRTFYGMKHLLLEHLQQDTLDAATLLAEVASVVAGQTSSATVGSDRVQEHAKYLPVYGVINGTAALLRGGAVGDVLLAVGLVTSCTAGPHNGQWSLTVASPSLQVRYLTIRYGIMSCMCFLSTHTVRRHCYQHLLLI